MTAWHERPFLAVDTETTGVDPSTDRIVEVATVLVDPDGSLREPWSTVVNPGVEIPDEAAAIHGITNERALAEGVTPESAVRRVSRVLRTHAQCPVVIYNATFDLPLLLNEAARHDVEISHLPLVLDPFVIDKALDRFRKGSRKLIDTAAHYGVTLDEAEAHGALADATAAGRLMRAILRSNPQLKVHTLSSLFLRTAAHAESQRASFVEYKRRTEPGFEKPAGWPLPVAS